MCFSKNNLPDYNDLNRLMEIFLQQECLWNEKCDYIQPENCSNLNNENYNLLILQLNICGMLSHQDDLKMLLHTLNTKKSSIDMILLCKTFLNNKTINLINVPGYTMISNNRSQAKGGGTAILIREGLKYSTRKDLDVFIEKKVESVFIELLTKSNKHIVVGSMYRPTNNTEDTFLETILSIRHKLSKEHERKELIIVIGTVYHNSSFSTNNNYLSFQIFPRRSCEPQVQERACPARTYACLVKHYS